MTVMTDIVSDNKTCQYPKKAAYNNSPRVVFLLHDHRRIRVAHRC